MRREKEGGEIFFKGEIIVSNCCPALVGSCLTARATRTVGAVAGYRRTCSRRVAGEICGAGRNVFSRDPLQKLADDGSRNPVKFFWVDSEPRPIRDTAGALLRIGHHVDIYTKRTAAAMPRQGFPSTMASVSLATSLFSPRRPKHRYRDINADC